MQIQGETLLDFLKKNSNYVIPFYQREYSWEKPEMEQLLRDINSISGEDYFLGSILVKKYLLDTIIVDGQQRISSSLIFLKVISEKCTNDKYLVHIEDLISKSFHSANLIDGDVLQKILEGKTMSVDDKKTRYHLNAEICRKFITKENADAMFEKFMNIKVATIAVDENIDEHKLFAQINTTGKKLNVFDLVKNFLFSKLDKEEVDEKLEVLYTITNEMSDALRKDMIRHFIAYHSGVLHKKDDNVLYQQVVELYNYYNEDAGFMIDKLFEFGLYYRGLQLGEFENNFSDELRLIQKSFATYAVVIVDIFKTHSDIVDYEVEISTEQIQEIKKALLVLEAYKVRREFVGLKEKELTRFIPTIPFRVDDIPEGGYDAKLVQILLYEANGEEGHGYRMPTVDEFKAAIKEKDIYSTPKFVKDFLVRLEKYNTKENTDFDKFTIEHIMPQTLTDEWQRDIDEDRSIHHKFLHSIGNLTLTADNSELGQMTFVNKKEYLKENSRIVLNNQLDQYDHWDYITIVNRAGAIFEQCQDIWNIEDQYNVITKAYYDSQETIDAIERVEKELEFKNIKKNKGFFKEIDMTYDSITEVLSLFLVDGMGTEKIDSLVWGISKKGWVSWSIINDLGLKSKTHKKSMSKDEFGLSIDRFDSQIKKLVTVVANL